MAGQGRGAGRSRGTEEQEAPDKGPIAQSMFLDKQKHAFHLRDVFPSPDNSEVRAFNTHLRKHSILCTNPACPSQHTASKRKEQLNGEMGRRVARAEHARYNSSSQKKSGCSALTHSQCDAQRKPLVTMFLRDLLSIPGNVCQN